MTVAGGLSRARLQRLHDVMAAHVGRGDPPGLITAVWRRGEAHVEAVGSIAAGGAPMRRDTIVRIASMTKPVAAVAALILIEECRLRLDEPVDRLLPELANRRVLCRLDGPLDDTIPAHRPVTVRDLLTLRLGFGFVLEPGDFPIMAAANEQGLLLGPTRPQAAPTPDEWLRRFATLPLMRQPGDAWMYDTGLDVLGVLIARAAGQPLDVFLRERIFEPLGMRDTGFHVPPRKLDRLAISYARNPATGVLELYDAADATSGWAAPPAFPSAAAGLVSTADDYLAFGLMLLNGGRHGGTRILSRPAVELMTTDQLTPAQRAGGRAILGDGRGWGLGLAVVTERVDLAASPGRFGWDGGLGTSWASDPREGVVAVLLTQSAWTSPGPPDVYRDFWTSVYQAIDD